MKSDDPSKRDSSPVLSSLGFLDIVEAYLADCKARGISRTETRSKLVSFARWIEDRCGAQFPLEEIPKRVLVEWASQGTSSTATIANRIGIVRLCFRYAYENRLLSAAPILAFAKGPKPNRRRRDPLTPDEIRAVLDSLYAGPPSRRPSRVILRDRVIVQLALLGLRSVEICRLQWTDFKKEYFEVRVKGGEIRRFVIDLQLADALKDWAECVPGDSPYLLRSNYGCNVHIQPSHTFLHLAFKRILNRANVHRASYAGSHLWRHSIATILYKQTGDIDRVKRFMGHKCMSTTEGYIHAGPHDQAESLESVKASFSEIKPAVSFETPKDYWRKKK